MKKIIVLVFVLFMVFDTLSAATCVCHRKTKEGEFGPWDWWQAKLCCYDSGVNCMKEECNVQTQGNIETTTGGFNLTLQLLSVDLKILQPGPSGDTWVPYVRDGKNYPFDDFDYVEITDCDTYPELEGRKIELDEIITDNNGNYTVFVPTE